MGRVSLVPRPLLREGGLIYETCSAGMRYGQRTYVTYCNQARLRLAPRG